MTANNRAANQQPAFAPHQTAKRQKIFAYLLFCVSLLHPFGWYTKVTTKKQGGNHEFDKKGNLTKWFEYDNNGELKRYYVYEYNSFNERTKTVEYNPDGTVIRESYR